MVLAVDEFGERVAAAGAIGDDDGAPSSPASRPESGSVAKGRPAGTTSTAKPRSPGISN